VSTLDDMSFVAASGNVISMALVGPAMALVGRRLGWSYRRTLTVQLIGWSALLVAQFVMIVWFGFVAGHPGFKYVQLLTLPIATVNFTASVWMVWKQTKAPALPREPSEEWSPDVSSARH
jgi:hypothetical protein